MMKKMGRKIKEGSLGHIVDYKTFMNDDELRQRYSKIEIKRTAFTPFTVMNLDEFIESLEKELRRESID